MSIYRPDKKYFESKGYISLATTYRWYWLKRSDTSDDLKRKRLWAEDNGRIYYACPVCSKLIQSYCDTSGAGGTINGRDLDTFSCEVCNKGCGNHFWLTFADAISRKIAGAIRLRPKSCPYCKGAITVPLTMTESNFVNYYGRGEGIKPFPIEAAICKGCSRIWRTDFPKEKKHG